MPKIKYAGQMEPIPEKAQDILFDIMENAGVESVLITSTTRSPKDQARIMYDNLEKYGINTEKHLYRAPGCAVIDVYAHSKTLGLTSDAVKATMEEKIVELGPQTVSRHCAIPTERSVFDVAPSSIPMEKKAQFETAVVNNNHVDKFLRPPVDPAYHIEISLDNGEDTIIQPLI